jgi:hypothetical protein
MREEEMVTCLHACETSPGQHAGTVEDAGDDVAEEEGDISSCTADVHIEVLVDSFRDGSGSWFS